MTRVGIPGGASGKEPASQWRRLKRHKFDPWVGMIPWRRAWQATPVFLPGNPVDRGDWLAMVCRVAKSGICLKQLSMHTHTHTHTMTRIVFPVGKSSGDHIWSIVFCNYSICFEWMPPLSLHLLPLPSTSLRLNSLLVIDTLGISTTLESPVLFPCFTHTFILYYIRFTSLASDNTNT